MYPGYFQNFTKVKFTVEENMACIIFNSCRKVSLIAQASLQSSNSFLDFMGVNGQNQSLSIITFNVTKGNGKTPIADEFDPSTQCQSLSSTAENNLAVA